MNAKRKEAALNKFKPLVADNTRESLKVIILEDEKAYPEKEAEEILNDLYADSEPKEPVTKVKAEQPESTPKKIAANIIDSEIRPSGKTDVTLTGGTGADTEWIRNKETGNEVKMNGEFARKKARREPNKYEIIVK